MARSRLATLSHAQLFELAVDACESSPEIKNKPDALIAEVAPLPSWCVDILLSPDLLPRLFSSLSLSEHAAAGVCSTWSRAYSRQLRRCRYVDLRNCRVAEEITSPNGLCMLPGGVLAITCGGEVHNGRETVISFVAARNDFDPQALAAYQASSLAARRFEWSMGLALTNDGLLACSMRDASTALYKFALDGSMDELATVPVLANYGQGFTRCAVHQQTQRTYAIINDEDLGRNALVILDANLQYVVTVETTDYMWSHYGHYGVPIRDVAAHGDQVIILTGNGHAKGSGLRLLDLDGRFLRTIAAEFRSPYVVTASYGRAFVVDDDDYIAPNTIYEYAPGPGKLLHVIDIQSGNFLQSVPFRSAGDVSAIHVDGDEIYIACRGEEKVLVLQFAGSEA